jgi:tRNA-dihydrouridine synthase 1
MHFPLRSDTDLNLGCPQDIAREEHFGAYLLGRKDWPLVQSIGEQNHPMYILKKMFGA